MIAFLFTRLGLLRAFSAILAALLSTIIYLSGGVIGTFHHPYFTGTPTPVLAWGAVFRAMEVVPLVLIGAEGYANLALARARPWAAAYKWPIYCFVAVTFWNLVGAGLFGFLINPPIALYYMQGLNTTPVHAHTALCRKQPACTTRSRADQWRRVSRRRKRRCENRVVCRLNSRSNVREGNL